MSGFYIKIIWVLYLTPIHCSNFDINSEITRYIKQQLYEQVEKKMPFNTNKLNDPPDLSINFWKSINHNFTGIRGLQIFSVFNRSYVASLNQFYDVIIEENQLILSESDMVLNHTTNNISFFNVAYYNEYAILPVRSQPDTLLIYQQNNASSKFNLQQTILLSSIIDARVFLQNGCLYLALIYNSKDVSLGIYKWTSTYFDEILNVNLGGESKGFMKIFSFSKESSEIILIPNIQNQFVVYKFQYERLKKSQIIDMQINNINLFNDKDLKYLILSNNVISKFFFWSGHHFVYWKSDYNNVWHKKFTVLYNKERQPFLLSPSKNQILVYNPSKESFFLLPKIQLSRGATIIRIFNAKINGNNKIFIATLQNDGIIRVEIHNFESVETGKLRKSNLITTCLETIEDKLFVESQKIDTLINDNIKLRKRIKRTADSNDLMNRFKNLVSKKRTLNDFISKYSRDKVLIINGPKLLRKSLTADQLIVNQLNFKRLNVQNWTPEQWLRYEQPQTVTGEINYSEMSVRNVVSNKFLDLLTISNGHQVLSGHTRVNNLTLSKLTLKQINDVPFDDIYFISNSTKITGLKEIQHLQAHGVKTSQINQENTYNVLESMSSNRIMHPKSNMFINEIEVEQINNVNWEEFVNEVYQMNNTELIEGNLHFKKIRVSDLITNSMNDVHIDKLFTTTTDQDIKSTLQVNTIFCENLTTGSINNIQLNQSVSLMDKAILTSPVKSDKMVVSRSLELSTNFDKELLQNEHVIGTEESDLLQIYNGFVHIKGDLHVTNLLLHPSTQLVLSNQSISSNFTDQFWTKSTPQVIGVHFEAINGMEASHLITENINGLVVNDFMLRDKVPKPTKFFFENATVSGNVLLNPQLQHSPNLEAIDRESVKTSGSFVITGHKIYTDLIRVQNFNTNILQNIRINNVLNKKTSAAVTSQMNFTNIVVKGNLSSTVLVNNLNNNNVEALLSNTLFINQPGKVNKLRINNLSSNNLTVINLNEQLFDKIILEKQKLYVSDKITALEITGDVTLLNIDQVQRLNNIDLIAILSPNLITEIQKITFTGTTFVDDLQARFINNVDFKSLTNRVFYKNLEQEILAPYIFEKITTKDLYVNTINKVSLKNIIDRTLLAQEIFAPLGIKFNSPTELNLVYSSEVKPCNIQTAYNNMRYEPFARKYRQVTIKGNATLFDNNTLSNIFNNLVLKNTPNTILSPIFTTDLRTNNLINLNEINKVNLSQVFEDAVLSQSEDRQIIRGRKIFSELHTILALINGNLDSQVLNEQIVVDFNNSIICKEDLSENSLILGKKTFFSGLQTTRLNTKLLANTNPQVIFDSKQPREVSTVICDTVEVFNDFNIVNLNNMNFEGIMFNRLLINSTQKQAANGVYFFENLNILDDLTTPAINDLKISNVVFDNNQQTILASKKFHKDVKIAKNANIELLNGVKFSESYEKSVLNNEPTDFKEFVTVYQPVDIDSANISAETINNYPVAIIKEILEQGATKADADLMRHLSAAISSNIKVSWQLTKDIETGYMYMEHSGDIQIAIQNSISAHTMPSEGLVGLQVIERETGLKCGLPSQCPCFVQHIVEISPQHSISEFVKQSVKKSFNYNDNSMLITVTTNSLNTSRECFTNITDEEYLKEDLSLMTWGFLSKENKAIGRHFNSEHIQGYISDVKVFTMEGETYMILGRYYDSLVDSYDLDCLVFKFSKDNATVREIQRIPTKGVGLIHLFYTNQGVIVVIGNTISNYFQQTSTNIYRFDRNAEQFILLREISSTVCTAATGIVFGPDSFLALAYQNDPVQDVKIYKYNVRYDTYDYYQSLRVGAPVLGLSVSYMDGLGISDAYVYVVTDYNNFLVFTFKYMEGWILSGGSEIEGLRQLVPFSLNNRNYLFAATSNMSSILTVIRHDSN